MKLSGRNDCYAIQLPELLQELSTNPVFIGSPAHFYANSSFMTDDAVIQELQRQAKSLRHINQIVNSIPDKTGELTKDERKFLTILEKFNY